MVETRHFCDSGSLFLLALGGIRDAVELWPGEVQADVFRNSQAYMVQTLGTESHVASCVAQRGVGRAVLARNPSEAGVSFLSSQTTS